MEIGEYIGGSGEMITLLDKQKIILKHYHDGKSQRAIQRETVFAVKPSGSTVLGI